MNKYEESRVYFQSEQIRHNLTNTQRMAHDTFSHYNEVKNFILTLQEFIKNGEFENLLQLVENTLPCILEDYPKILFWIYKCWFLVLKKQRNVHKAEYIYQKFLFPSYRRSDKFKNKITTFSVILHSQNSEILNKIDKYSEKFVSLLENILMENLKVSRRVTCGGVRKIGAFRDAREKSLTGLQYCESRHMAILSKLDISEDDSSLSDIEDDILKTCQVSNIDIENECGKIFEIKKERKMTLNSINSVNSFNTFHTIQSSSSTISNNSQSQENYTQSLTQGLNQSLTLTQSLSQGLTPPIFEITKTDRKTMDQTSLKILQSNSISTSSAEISQEFSSLNQFAKFVEYVQDSKEFQPLICLSKENGVETYHDTRKTSQNFMDVETEMGYEFVNREKENDIEMSGELSDSKSHSINLQSSTSLERLQNIQNPASQYSINFNSFNSFKIPKNYKIDPINEPFSNLNFYNKPYIPKVKSKEKLKNLVPFLKDFKPKFLKKENIDKKILRKFRNYVKIIYKIDKEVLDDYERHFWKDFTTINLLPPMKYEDEYKIRVEFKSFNTKYLLWLFGKEGCSKMYTDFASKFSEQILQDFVTNYDLVTIDSTSEEGIIEKLRYYIKAIPEIYSKRSHLIETTNDNYTQSNLSYTGHGGTVHSEELLASYLGADFNFGKNTFNLKNFGVEPVYPRKCAVESHRNYYEDYESYCHLSDESFDSIPSVE